jgi:molecular chaperone DnaK (HSP70)
VQSVDQFRYLIGIDLGTTNSAVAFVDLAEERAEGAPPSLQIFEIPQLVAPGEVADRRVLPSFLYLPGAYDLPPEATALPWVPERDYAVGEFAREQGARVPGRLVASAKSWLGHPGVDRTAPILPWGAREEVAKVSPVEASKRYLQHIREAWNARMAQGQAELLFEQQQLILTVPASFDEVARELTLAAARAAGLTRTILLEEPLAAFYAWLARHEHDWESLIQPGQLVLVSDVGGGTTDFTVIGLQHGEQGVRLNRLAVGEHLMLGGDNMDLALARQIEIKLFGQPGKLDANRWHGLVQQCRKAKETLLGDPDSDGGFDVTIIGAPGQLIGGTLKSRLTHAEVQALVLDGFLPQVALTDPLANPRRTGLAELGLPYVQDPAITRHLTAFWRRSEPLLQEEMAREAVFPDYLLFNGGALTPAAVRERLHRQIEGWFRPIAGADWSPVELANPQPELAVALGAAYYGLVRLGAGVRIGSGSPRAYYVGVDTGTKDALPDHYSAVCLVPRGAEAGFAAELATPQFAALTNQPVSFQIYTSSTRLGDRLGDVVQLTADEVSILPPIRTVLRYGRKGVAQQLPVGLAVRLTEIGTLELWCQSRQTEHRWQLAFDVRQELEPEDLVQTVSEVVDQALIDAAQAEIQLTFQRGAATTAHPPEGLRKRLETILDLPKEAWPTPLIRKLADTLLAVAEDRGRSATHEAYWLNLLGFCLRPGFGDPADELRMREIWKVYLQGVSFASKPQNRIEWWICWRRLAGGLKPGHQLQIYDQVRPVLQPVTAQKKSKNAPARLSPAEELEVWLALANFEWLPVQAKVELGRLILGRVRKTPPKRQELWALSRLGARTPLYGPLDRLIPPSEAAAWLQTLLALKLERTEYVARALIGLAQVTGDRSRDLPDEVRAPLLEWLAALPQAERLRQLLLDPASQESSEEQDWRFGEALPAGLVLATGSSV